MLFGLLVTLTGAAWAEAPAATAPAPAATEATATPPTTEASTAAATTAAGEGTAQPAPAPAGGVVDRVVAVVEDEVILLSEVYEFSTYIDEAVAAGGEAARAQAESEVLERLIERILIDRTVQELGLGATETQVDRAIDEIARRNGLDRDTLRAEVEKSGMPWEVYRDELRAQLEEGTFLNAVVRPRVTITEDELRDAWRRLTAGGPAVAEVQAIFLPAGDEAARQAALVQAEALRARAAAGEDFAALSAQFDQGGFGARGGVMGRFAPGDLTAALDAAVQGTAVGAVAAPVAIEQGVFLLRVSDRSTAGPAFEDVRDRLEAQVGEEHMVDEQKRWYQQARREASVRVMLHDGAAAAP